MSSLSLRAARLVTAAIALVAVAALVLLSLPARNTTHRVLDLALAAPTGSVTPSAAPTSPTPSPTPSPSILPILAVAPSTTPSAPRSSSSSTPVSPPSTGSSSSGGSSPTVTATCPLGLKVPTETGGLQSLISLAPAFGPFSAEAFAAAGAYAPLLTLLGPILAEYPALAPKFASFTNPLVAVFAAITTAGFGLLSPLYGPYREKVLDAESKLAAAFAPYANQLVNSPVGGCAIAVESLLLDPASASAITTQLSGKH
jgi:hypothetical protein